MGGGNGGSSDVGGEDKNTSCDKQDPRRGNVTTPQTNSPPVKGTIQRRRLRAPVWARSLSINEKQYKISFCMIFFLFLNNFSVEISLYN